MNGGSAPDAPDPEASARAQARYNRIDQTTPWGSLTFSGENNSQANLELSPEVQQIVDQRQGISQEMLQNAGQRAGNLPNSNFDPDIPTVGGEAGSDSIGPLSDLGQSTQAQEASFEQAMNLIRPEMERRGEGLRQTMANQGLPMGSEAFGEEFDRFNQQQNQATQQAAYQAVQEGNQRQNQLFQQGLSAMGAEQQARSQNINELQSLLQGGQVNTPQMGNFFGPSQVDVMGPLQQQHQSQMAQYQAGQQRQNAQLGALAGLGSAAMYGATACSHEYKENKRLVSEVLPRVEALKVEAWDYKPGHGDERTHIGPYAEDFARLFGVGDGKTISLIDAVGVCLLAIQELAAEIRYLRSAARV